MEYMESNDGIFEQEVREKETEVEIMEEEKIKWRIIVKARGTLLWGGRNRIILLQV